MRGRAGEERKRFNLKVLIYANKMSREEKETFPGENKHLNVAVAQEVTLDVRLARQRIFIYILFRDIFRISLLFFMKHSSYSLIDTRAS